MPEPKAKPKLDLGVEVPKNIRDFVACKVPSVTIDLKGDFGWVGQAIKAAAGTAGDAVPDDLAPTFSYEPGDRPNQGRLTIGLPQMFGLELTAGVSIVEGELRIDVPDTVPDFIEDPLEKFPSKLNHDLKKVHRRQLKDLTFEDGKVTLTKEAIPTKSSSTDSAPETSYCQIPIAEFVNRSGGTVTLTCESETGESTEMVFQETRRYFLGARLRFGSTASAAQSAPIEIEKQTTGPTAGDDGSDRIGTEIRVTSDVGAVVAEEVALVVGSADLEDPSGEPEVRDYYLQDSWQSRDDRWSFAIGLRHEVPPADARTEGPTADDATIQPRLGVKYVLGRERVDVEPRVERLDDAVGVGLMGLSWMEIAAMWGATTFDRIDARETSAEQALDLRFGAGNQFGLSWSPSLNIRYRERDETGALRDESDFLATANQILTEALPAVDGTATDVDRELVNRLFPLFPALRLDNPGATIVDGSVGFRPFVIDNDVAAAAGPEASFDWSLPPASATVAGLELTLSNPAGLVLTGGFRPVMPLPGNPGPCLITVPFLVTSNWEESVVARYRVATASAGFDPDSPVVSGASDWAEWTVDPGTTVDFGLRFEIPRARFVPVPEGLSARASSGFDIFGDGRMRVGWTQPWAWGERDVQQGGAQWNFDKAADGVEPDAWDIDPLGSDWQIQSADASGPSDTDRAALRAHNQVWTIGVRDEPERGLSFASDLTRRAYDRMTTDMLATEGYTVPLVRDPEATRPLNCSNWDFAVSSGTAEPWPELNEPDPNASIATSVPLWKRPLVVGGTVLGLAAAGTGGALLATSGGSDSSTAEVPAVVEDAGTDASPAGGGTDTGTDDAAATGGDETATGDAAGDQPAQAAPVPTSGPVVGQQSEAANGVIFDANGEVTSVDPNTYPVLIVRPEAASGTGPALLFVLDPAAIDAPALEIDLQLIGSQGCTTGEGAPGRVSNVVSDIAVSDAGAVCFIPQYDPGLSGSVWYRVATADGGWLESLALLSDDPELLRGDLEFGEFAELQNQSGFRMGGPITVDRPQFFPPPIPVSGAPVVDRFFATGPPADAGSTGDQGQGGEITVDPIAGTIDLTVVEATADDVSLRVAVSISDPIFESGNHRASASLLVRNPAGEDFLFGYIETDGEPSIETINLNTGGILAADTSIGVGQNGDFISFDVSFEAAGIPFSSAGATFQLDTQVLPNEDSEAVFGLTEEMEFQTNP